MILVGRQTTPYIDISIPHGAALLQYALIRIQVDKSSTTFGPNEKKREK